MLPARGATNGRSVRRTRRRCISAARIGSPCPRASPIAGAEGSVRRSRVELLAERRPAPDSSSTNAVRARDASPHPSQCWVYRRDAFQQHPGLRRSHRAEPSQCGVHQKRRRELHPGLRSSGRRLRHNSSYHDSGRTAVHYCAVRRNRNEHVAELPRKGWSTFHTCEARARTAARRSPPCPP